MKKKIIIVLISIIITSCLTPQQKINKLLTKYPELLQHDTIEKKVPFIIKEYKRDTSFVDIGDTIYLNDGNLEVEYFTVHDTVHLKGKCKGDTIIQTIQVPVDKIIYPQVKKLTFWERLRIYLGNISIVLIFAACIYAGIKIYRKVNNI